MITAKDLRSKFEEDLRALQADCLHEKTEWMPYMWAPGHMGAPVEVCYSCEKVLKKAITSKDL